MKPDHNFNVRPDARGTQTKVESAGAVPRAGPASGNNWEWAMRIQAKEKIVVTALQIAEALISESIMQIGTVTMDLNQRTEAVEQQLTTGSQGNQGVKNDHQ